jgi:Flp pilus assembly protein TadG
MWDRAMRRPAPAIIAAFRTSVRRFSRSTRASVAVNFALVMMPLVLASGSTIDIMAASRVKDTLQAAADAAALNAISLSKTTPDFTDQAMRSIVNANLGTSDQARLQSLSTTFERK